MTSRGYKRPIDPEERARKIRSKECVNCFRPLNKLGSVQCCVKDCGRFVHAVCSKLSEDELNKHHSDYKGHCYKCHNCCPPVDEADDGEEEDLSDEDISDQPQSHTGHLVLLRKIYAELKVVRCTLKRYDDENVRLRCEVSDLRRCILNNTRDSSRSRSHSRSRSNSRSRRPNVKHNREDRKKEERNQAAPSVFFENVNPNRRNRQTPPPGRSQLTTSGQVKANPAKSKIRSLRVVRNEEDEEETAMIISAADGVRMNPVRVKLHQIYISNLSIGTTAKHVYDHLRSKNISPRNVRKVKPSVDEYSSFIVDVTELSYEKMFLSKTWPVDTYIQDYVPRREATVIEVFPPCV